MTIFLLKNFAKKSSLNKLIFIFILSIFLMQFNNFFLNTYVIFNKKYQERLISVYGYCDKQGYGFIKSINDELNLSNNVKIINYDLKYPSSYIFVNQFHEIKDYQYLILLNYYETNDLNKDFKKLKSYESCRLYKKR
jgi:hypothetical protein